MRVLVTNDDGIDSPGLHALAAVVVGAGCEVVVAAPHTERSGASASLTAQDDGRLVVREHRVEGLDVPVLAVEATPAFIAVVAARGAFGKPADLVVSGINRGPNTGHATLHSGTVGAALTATTFGQSGLAVSLAADRWTNLDTAALVARSAFDWLVEHPLERAVLNINVPDVPVERLRGLRRAELAAFGAVEGRIGERGQGFVTLTFAEPADEPQPGTDVALLRQGWATATVLRSPCVVDGALPEALPTPPGGLGKACARGAAVAGAPEEAPPGGTSSR